MLQSTGVYRIKKMCTKIVSCVNNINFQINMRTFNDRELCHKKNRLFKIMNKFIQVIFRFQLK